MVLYPRGGLCKQKLVAVVSLKDMGGAPDSSNTVEVVDSSSSGAASLAVNEISNNLATILPSYMVPNLWIVIKSFPLLLSGKLNRKRVEQWIAEVDDTTHRRICGLTDSPGSDAPSTVVEQQLQRIWADVLKLPIQDIGVKQPFTSLGGDSILAMQVVAQSRKSGIHINLVDIFSARTIFHLAQRAKTANTGAAVAEAPAREEDKTNELFDLTPIQRFYADVALGPDFVSRETNKRFNHTFALRVRRTVTASDMARALDALVQRHSMLRARFRPNSGPNHDRWMQLISDKAADSYRFRAWDNCTPEQARTFIEEARVGLDVERGPLMAADLVTTDAEHQHFFIVAHHLVVDMVSWTVILRDLESLLTTGTPASTDPPFPFQAWAKLQAEHAATALPPTTALPTADAILPADLRYWGMEKRTNVARDALSHTITLPRGVTTALLQTCNASYRAEPMDVLTSTLSHAFSYVFTDRATPTIYRYGHGRESWTPRLENAVAETVGWFTTLSPVRVAVGQQGREDSVTVLRRTVEQRQRVPLNGWAYFASRYHHPEGAAAFAGHERMEVTINYLGNQGGLAGKNAEALFEIPDDFEEGGLGAGGQDVKCFSLFSVTAAVDWEGRLGIKCAWNRHAGRQEGIARWFRVFERLLLDVAERAVPRAMRLGAGVERRRVGVCGSSGEGVVGVKGRRSAGGRVGQRSLRRRG